MALFAALHQSDLRMPAVEYVGGPWSGGPMTLNRKREQEISVDVLAEKLDARLREWKPETAAEARERIAEVIDLADHGVLDIARSRVAEQEVLDLLDEPPTR